MIEATAPVRICDIGGWTDTWFGGPGRVVNFAVRPGARVTVSRSAGSDPVMLHLPDFDAHYPVAPREPRSARHPLVEAALDGYAGGLPVPVEVTVSSGVPPGCGTGTSAAVAVAGVAALMAAAGRSWTQAEVARAAHRLEVEVLGAESGVQDQMSAAFGGINHLEVEPYPDTTVERLPAWPELGPLLSVVYLGRAHRSSDVHRQVIAGIRSGNHGALDRLRTAAASAREAVLARDPGLLAGAMTANTAAQAELHPALVGTDARAVICLAQDAGAVGWKVNGAGGDGGSLTVLSPTRTVKRGFDNRVAAAGRSYRILPVVPCAEGVVVRGSP